MRRENSVVTALEQSFSKVKKSEIFSNIDRITQPVTDFIRGNPIVSTAVVGAGVTGVATIISTKRRTSKKKKPKRKLKRKLKRRNLSRDRKFRSKQKHELRYVKRKRKAGKKITRPAYKRRSKKRVGKIYRTKTGQPYKIMANGRARFIKRK